ncbi:MAG: V4R domain-containing protein [Candidatus Bathyarchaeia archaeon]
MINEEILKFNKKDLLYYAGEKLGLKEFANIQIRNVKDALEKIAEAYFSETMGLIKVDRINSKFLIVKIYNCATCSNSEKNEQMHCWFDAGYIAGALKAMLKKDFIAFEVECKAAGFEACKFIVTLKPTKRNLQKLFINLKPMDKMPF